MYYLLALIVPPLVLLLGRRWRPGRTAVKALAVVSMLGMYAITVGSAQVHSMTLERELSHFDRDKDGVISLSEQSPQQSAAMERLVNDAGRNMTLFLAIPWAAGVSAAFFLIVLMVERRPTRRSSGSRPASAELQR